MLEAVNSVLQTAPVARPQVEQQSTADSFAANPERVQKAPQAPFVSPYIFVDVSNNTAVLQIRNSDTGDVENQFPSEARLQAQARERAVQNQQFLSSSPSGEGVAQLSDAQSSTQETQTSDVATTSAPIQPQQIAAFSNAASAATSGTPQSVEVLA